MRCSTGLILAAMAIGDAMAGPTHAHLHRRAHEKKDINYATLDVDWASAYSVGMAEKSASAAAAAKATTAPVVAAAAVTTAAQKASSTAKASTAVSSSTSSTSSTSEGLLSGLVGLANALTSFGTATAPSGSGIDKIGNIGSPQGSNIIKVSSRQGYAFTNEFINTSGKSMTINCWNKAAYWESAGASTVQANLGASIAPKQTALTFVLAAGASQIVAFQEDTQFSCAQATTAINEASGFATTWIEGNFASSGSGYDVTAIQNPSNNYDMTITSVEAPACTSSRTENMWLTDSDPVGNSDGSCYIAQSTATLTTKMGGTIS